MKTELEQYQELEEMLFNADETMGLHSFEIKDLAKVFFDWMHQQQPPALTEEQMEQEAREYAKPSDYPNEYFYPNCAVDDIRRRAYLAALRKHATPPTVVEETEQEEQYEFLCKSEPGDLIKIDGWIPVPKHRILDLTRIPELVEKGVLRKTPPTK